MPTEMVYRSHLKKACTAAKITKWPHNCLRHSYASYNLAHFRNAPALALEMGHNGTDHLFQRYRELVKPKAAKTFWDIYPIEAEKVTPIRRHKTKRA